MSKIRSAVGAVVVYLRDNPGVVSLIVGQTVLAASYVGLNVTVSQLYQIGTVLVPLLLAYGNVAKKASVKAAEPAPAETPQ